MAEGPVIKEKGIRHLFAAARYSTQGFFRLISESAFRHELLALGAGYALLLATRAALSSFLGFTVLMLVLFAAEALNTAIEELVDRVSPEISPVGKHAKDLGSFAVSCLIVANVLFLAWAVFLG